MIMVSHRTQCRSSHPNSLSGSGRLNDSQTFGHIAFTDARTFSVDFLARELEIGSSIDLR
jgi:hypothetical protein